jgi:hypothetical protein
MAEDLEALASELIARGHDPGLVRRRLGLTEPPRPSDPEDVAHAVLLEKAQAGDPKAAEALIRLGHSRELKDLKRAEVRAKIGDSIDREKKLRQVLNETNTPDEQGEWLALFDRAVKEGADSLSGDEARTFVRLYVAVEVAAKAALGDVDDE